MTIGRVVVCESARLLNIVITASSVYPVRFEVWAFSASSQRLSRLSYISEYLAIDSGGNVSE